MLLSIAILSLFTAQMSDASASKTVEPSEKRPLPEVVASLGQQLDKLPEVFADLPDKWKIPGLVESLSLYFLLEDPETDTSVKATCLAALVYVISPADILPDEIPLFGQLDDLSVLLYTFHAVLGAVQQRHLDRASEWLAAHGFPAAPFFTVSEIHYLSDALGLYRSIRSYLTSKGKTIPGIMDVATTALSGR